jgi:hypothetical protein
MRPEWFPFEESADYGTIHFLREMTLQTSPGIAAVVPTQQVFIGTGMGLMT